MKVDLKKLRGNPEAPLLAIDLFMVLLVLFNLVWIVFNALFSSQVFQSGVAFLSPEFHLWYRDDIQPDFADYDMIFVAIYITELLFRWAIAVFRKTYHRWFFYPFIHWYDVLGCIPVGSFRWLRVLRVFALLWRLQKQGVIDLKDSWLVRTGRKYLDILTEEISDRVVINVLDGVHAEVARGNPVISRIGSEAIAPHREELVSWMAERLRQGVDAAWQENRKPLQGYLQRVVMESLDASEDIQRLERLPLVGPQLGATLDTAVSDIARHLVDRIAHDIADSARQEQVRKILSGTLDSFARHDEQLARLLRDVLLDSIVIIKQQVAVQEWKLRESTGHYD